ncbi:MAG: phytoene desaturase family protein [Candidatus Brocadiia bacterium]
MGNNGEGQVGIVGGGLGGLAAACVLSARGHEVTLFEGNPWVGGKAAVLEQDGFRFDMGPTILSIPRVLRRIFAEADRDLDEELELVRLDPQWRCFFEDGSRLDLLENTGDMAEELSEFGSDLELPEGYREFMDLSDRLRTISEEYFFWKPVGSVRDTLDVGGAFKLSVLADLMAMRFGHSVSGTVAEFLPDERVCQMAEHFTQYIGSSPMKAPAILCGIARMQTDEGIWYPIGGIRQVPVALDELARELGADIRTEARVQQIRLKDGAVAGLEMEDGETFACEAVVANSDSVRTHRELIGGSAARAFQKRRSYEPACSGVVLYLGLDRRYEQLLHHNFVFSRDPVEEFKAIYDAGEPAPDPTCYVCAPASTDPGVAPSGGEALYVLTHTPYLHPEHDWAQIFPRYRDKIVEKLKRTGGLEDLDDHIVFEAFLTPRDIHERYSVLQGAIYGLASHGRFVGAFKPNNRSPDVAGLYLAGGSAHPGAGMPMALMSGWIAADALDGDLTAG